MSEHPPNNNFKRGAYASKELDFPVGTLRFLDGTTQNTAGGSSTTTETIKELNNDTVFAWLDQLQDAINNVDTVVLFDSVVRDVNNNYNPGTGVYTTPQAGLYNFAFGLGLSSGDYPVLIKVNTTSHGDIATQRFNRMHSGALNSAFTALTVPLDAGDTVTFRVLQTSGVDKLISPGKSLTYFSMTFLGPLT